MNGVDVKPMIEQFIKELAQQCPDNHYRNVEDKATFGEEFENSNFKLVPFSYDSFEDEFEGDSGDDEWNFIWKNNNFKLSWYKHIGRGMRYSRAMSYAEFNKMREQCLKSLTPPED